MATEYIFITRAFGTVSKVDHIVTVKQTSTKFKIIEQNAKYILGS